MAPEMSRRGIVRAGGLAVLTAALTGCGIRLETDAPTVPVLPRRTPRPGESGLVALLANGERLRELAGRWSGPGREQSRALAALVGAQDSTLRSVLTAAGAPVPTPSPTSAAPTGTPAKVRSGELGAAAVEGARLTPALADLEAPLRPTAIAVLASRAAWAVRLGQPEPVAATDATPWSTGAAPWLQATRSAVYAFEVVTARSTGAQRTEGRTALERLHRLETEQLGTVGATPPPATIGGELPVAVTDAASARRLAVLAARTLRQAYAAALSSLPPGRPAFTAAVRWLGAAEALVLDWGGAGEPFPGLTT